MAFAALPQTTGNTLASIEAKLAAASNVTDVYAAWGSESPTITAMRNTVVAFLISSPPPLQTVKTEAVDALVVAEASIVATVHKRLGEVELDGSSARTFLTAFRENTSYLLKELEVAANSTNTAIAGAAARVYQILSPNPMPRQSGRAPDSIAQPDLPSLSSGAPEDQPEQMDDDLSEINQAKVELSALGGSFDEQTDESNDDYLRYLKRLIFNAKKSGMDSEQSASSGDQQKRLRGEINVIAQGIVEF